MYELKVQRKAAIQLVAEEEEWVRAAPVTNTTIPFETMDDVTEWLLGHDTNQLLLNGMLITITMKGM